MAAVAVALSSCGKRKTANGDAGTAAADTGHREFPTVTVPGTILPEDRAAYVVDHYWDRFDFRDTVYCHLPEVTEQAYADYIYLLPFVPRQQAIASINNLFDKAAADSVMFRYFASLAEKYFYDPNSPYRNDEFYIPVLQKVLASPYMDDVEKLRPENQLEMAMKNRVGDKAADFVYTTADGRQSRLYDLASEYILLFIYNPDCATCESLRNEIGASPMLSEMIENGTLKVLALYPDEDLTIWRGYRDSIPQTWINAYDKALKLRNDSLYDLKAIPSIYLLDKDKRVLLKDCSSVPMVEEALYYADSGDMAE